jgi:hypothetical protein
MSNLVPAASDNYKVFVSFRGLKFSVCVKLSLQTSAFIDHCISVYKKLTDDPAGEFFLSRKEKFTSRLSNDALFMEIILF